MSTKIESELPSSPQSYDSDGDEDVEPDSQEKELRQPVNNNVANILARLQSSGALFRKPKQEFYCFKCKLDFPNWDEAENHYIQHVSLPSVVLDKLPSDDEDISPSGDESWSDDENETTLSKISVQKTPQKVDISQILKNKGLSVKKTDSSANSSSALNKLGSLVFTIKNNTTPIKEESSNTNSSDVIQKLGKLGGIKLKLKSDGNNTNSFKVVNGLKDFKASDDEGEVSENVKDEDNNHGKLKINDVSISVEADAEVPRRRGRPPVKQTPRRTNLKSSKATVIDNIDSDKDIPSPSLERPDSNGSAETVIVKKEVNNTSESQSGVPLFSGQIKSERMSPPLPDSSSTPLITKIKTEDDISVPTTSTTPTVSKLEEPVAVIEINGDSNDEDDDCCVVSTTPATDIKPKIENIPIAPKVEEVVYPTSTTYTTPSAFSTPQTSNSSASTPISRAIPMQSTQKQHNFNWNAPGAKPPIDTLEKSADDIFESLLSSGTKKENMLSDTSEYISLDKLGTQNTCDVCNTRFTDISLLDEHKRMTGHSQSLVTATSTLLPYSPSSNLFSSLLPVKQMVDQVGKLSSIGNSGPGFTHQQNVMINIQAYPGSSGVVMPGQTPYNSFQSPHNLHSNYPPTTNMYGPTTQTMSGQLHSGNYMGANIPYGQYEPPISKSGFSVSMAQNSFPTQSPYADTSTLQGMQQATYGSSGIMNQQIPMGPPGSSPSQQHYAPVSSPSILMKPSSGVNIQNVQNFSPGHLVGSGITSASGQDVGQMSAAGQTVIGSMPPPPPLKVTAGPANMSPRPRVPGVRQAPRPTIRAGIQVHGQVRGAQRMTLKRIAGPGPGGPGIKRRPDILLPGKHDNEDCQVMAMQKQREGLPLIQSVQGAKDKLGSQISITKKTVNKEANAMANVLVLRGISVKQKQKSRSPTPPPERPIPHIPNLGSGISIKHTSKFSSSKFSVPESKVASGMLFCKFCKKMFGSQTSLQVHMENAHPQSKVPVFKCDECPASYPKSLQLQHHKRVFHNVNGPNKELGLPIVDLSNFENVKRLSNLGIYSFIPLANRGQSNGCFGIPVISVHNMQSGLTTGLQAIGADGLLSLGPLKPLPNTN